MGKQAAMTATRKPKTRLRRVYLCDGKGCRHDAAYVVITCYPGMGKKATYRRYCGMHLPRDD